MQRSMCHVIMKTVVAQALRQQTGRPMNVARDLGHAEIVKLLEACQ